MFWYAGCRAILSGIPDAEGWYAVFGCHELKSNKYFRTKTVEIHQIIF